MSERVEGGFTGRTIRACLTSLKEHKYRFNRWESSFYSDMVETMDFHDEFLHEDGPFAITVKQYNSLIEMRDKYT